VTGRRRVTLAMEIVILGNKPYAQKVIMIPNLTAIITIITSTLALILITFLPAFLELKKPKDAGPRMIMGFFPELKGHMTRFIPITNIEEEQKFDSSLIQTMAKIIAVLPSLEV
jgi:hypothetical protein